MNIYNTITTIIRKEKMKTITQQIWYSTLVCIPFESQKKKKKKYNKRRTNKR